MEEGRSKAPDAPGPLRPRADSDSALLYVKPPESDGRHGMESDHRYYSRRASEEQRRANLALTPAARQRHLELANLFATKAAQRAGPDNVLTPINAQ
jgi:hypothetical protein